jgi:hypothetical protein
MHVAHADDDTFTDSALAPLGFLRPNMIISPRCENGGLLPAHARLPQIKFKKCHMDFGSNDFRKIRHKVVCVDSDNS